MKKKVVIAVGALIAVAAIAVLLIFLLDDTYVKTPLAAYEKNPEYSFHYAMLMDDVDEEIGFIQVSEDFGVWVAVVEGEHVITKPMRIKRNAYCAVAGVSFYPLASMETTKPLEKPQAVRYDTYTISETEAVCFKLLPTVHMPPSAREADVHYQDLTVTVNGKTLALTAAYYLKSK